MAIATFDGQVQLQPGGEVRGRRAPRISRGLCFSRTLASRLRPSRPLTAPTPKPLPTAPSLPPPTRSS
jgi:hypothetical protein